MRSRFSFCLMLLILAGNVPVNGFFLPGPDENGSFILMLQKRNTEGSIRIETAEVKGSRMAIVVMDMWDRHWCESFTRKVDAMVEPMNRTLNAARQLGITIVFSPSEVTDFYDDKPQREIMKNFPFHILPERPYNPTQPPWNKTGGCECGPDRPCNIKAGSVWTRQHEDLEIRGEDFITESAQELYNLCRERGITMLLYMGVASNMCILNRPTGIIEMTKRGLHSIVVRDLSEAITGRGYNPDTRMAEPGLTPESGSRAVIEHIEQYIVPTISANQLFIAADIDDDIDVRKYAEPIFTREEVREYVPKGPADCFRHLCYDYNWQGRALSDIPKKFTRADPAEYAEFSKKMNLDAVLVLAVPHPGFTTYNSEVGQRFPGMKHDWFGEVIMELHKRNISAFAYITVGTNWKYMRDHIGKSYIHATIDETGLVSTRGLCLNAPGYQDLLIQYTHEVLENYPVDALRYDMLFSPKDCECEGCKDFYKELYGDDFSSWEETEIKFPKRKDFFYLETLNRTARRLSNACKGIKPSLEIWQNHINTYSEANINLGRNFDVAYIEFGDPFRLLALRGILDKQAIIVGQTLKSPIRRLIMALGARCYQYVPVDQETILPYEKDLDWFVNDLSPFFKMVSEIQPYLEHAVLPTNIGLVFSENTRYHFPDFDREPYMLACEGITMNYLERSIPVQFINCLDLGSQDLGKYKLLILPRTSGLTPEEIRTLKGYVNEGGNLLVTGDALLFNEKGDMRDDFSLSAELGLQYESIISDSIQAEINTDDSAFTQKSFLPETLQLAGVVRTTPLSGQTLASTSYKGKAIPLFHMNNQGKGTIAYVASSASTDLIGHACDRLTGPLSILVSDPEKQVILAHQEVQNRYVLHLLGEGDYSVYIDRGLADITGPAGQYPSTGWDYQISEKEDGLLIEISGKAENRILVFQ